MIIQEILPKLQCAVSHTLNMCDDTILKTVGVVTDKISKYPAYNLISDSTMVEISEYITTNPLITTVMLEFTTILSTNIAFSGLTDKDIRSTISVFEHREIENYNDIISPQHMGVLRVEQGETSMNERLNLVLRLFIHTHRHLRSLSFNNPQQTYQGVFQSNHPLNTGVGGCPMGGYYGSGGGYGKKTGG